jgi:hypothetical protein
VCKSSKDLKNIYYWFNLLLADQVFGDEEMHATVRQNCMDYIVSVFIEGIQKKGIFVV